MIFRRIKLPKVFSGKKEPSLTAEEQDLLDQAHSKEDYELLLKWIRLAQIKAWHSISDSVSQPFVAAVHHGYDQLLEQELHADMSYDNLRSAFLKYRHLYRNAAKKAWQLSQPKFTKKLGEVRDFESALALLTKTRSARGNHGRRIALVALQQAQTYDDCLQLLTELTYRGNQDTLEQVLMHTAEQAKSIEQTGQMYEVMNGYFGLQSYIVKREAVLYKQKLSECTTAAACVDLYEKVNSSTKPMIVYDVVQTARTLQPTAVEQVKLLQLAFYTPEPAEIEACEAAIKAALGT